MKQHLSLPQLPKQDQSGNINQQELIHFLSAIQRILSDKQREDYGENKSLGQLVSAHDSDIASHTTQIEALKPAIYCNGTMRDTTASWHGTMWLSWNIHENSGGWSQRGVPERIYPPKTGKYYIKVQQLILLNGGTIYYNLEKNAGTVVHAYTNSPYHTDMNVSAILHMTTNDFFSLRVVPSATMKAWGSTHSRFSIFYIGE